MASDYLSIDLSKDTVPDLAELADDVHRTNRPCLLERADEDIAVIMPVTKKRAKRTVIGKKSGADLEAFWSAFGRWNGMVDTDKLKADIAENRRLSTKPRPEL